MQRQEPASREGPGVWIVLGVLLVAVLVVPMLGGGLMGPGMMGWYGPRFGPFGANGWLWGLGMGLGWLAMLAFWGVLIAGAILLFRALVGPRGAGPTGPVGGDSALEILKRRYAAGELTSEQYQQMRQELDK
jgi:putative membrane protein